MEKILVTGAGGQLGKELQEVAAFFPQFRFIFLRRDEMPIQDEVAVHKIFNDNQPQYLINCAAYTAVDKAEAEKEFAFEVNTEAVKVVAGICKQYRTKLIHLSTDYVFDGAGTVPYKENDETNPQSVYGASKLEGEKQALACNPESIIIRTSWVYSRFGKNFVKTMMRLMKEKEEINVVNDQFGSPTYAADLAMMILEIIASGKWEPGIYHYSNKGVINWYSFALAIKELSGSTCIINQVTTREYPTLAKRPVYSALDISKIQKVFGIKPKNWEECLATCLAILNP